jgi:hypothetical protein
MTEKTRLPVVGSTAASTAFVSETVTGPGVGGGLRRLHLDGNGKVTAGNGTLHEPRPNALSLVQIETCPGSTATCRERCYVHNLQTAQGWLHDLYRENTATLREIGLGIRVLSAVSRAEREAQAEWAFIVAAWIREHARGGFRWHVSGDLMSETHAAWVRDVCLEVGPEIPMWIYTRSFDVVSRLMSAATLATGGLEGGNLSVNLSADRDNLSEAIACSRWHRTSAGAPRLCYLAADEHDNPDLLYLRSDDVIFPDYALRPRAAPSLAESPWWASLTGFQRGLVCPVDAHNKSEERRCGPCRRCIK